MRSLTLLFTAILCFTPYSQTQPSFEVATIKPSDPNAKHIMIGVTTTPDGLEAVMSPLSLRPPSHRLRLPGIPPR